MTFFDLYLFLKKCTLLPEVKYVQLLFFLVSIHCWILCRELSSTMRRHSQNSPLSFWWWANPWNYKSSGEAVLKRWTLSGDYDFAPCTLLGNLHRLFRTAIAFIIRFKWEKAYKKILLLWNSNGSIVQELFLGLWFLSFCKKKLIPK